MLVDADAASAVLSSPVLVMTCQSSLGYDYVRSYTLVHIKGMFRIELSRL